MRVQKNLAIHKKNAIFDPMKNVSFTHPATYKGLQNLHKYWGKKPSDLMAFLVDNFCPKNGSVLDPFMGYGSVSRETIESGRQFHGIDINPAAVRLARLISSPPLSTDVKEIAQFLKATTKEAVNQSYLLERADGVATHYLWSGNEIVEIWSAGQKRRRVTHAPSAYYIEQCKKYTRYKVRNIRPMQFFHNARINTNSAMSLKDIFTGRALYNIDLLLDAINRIEDVHLREAFMLVLTSAVGQMSRMVFAITRRGKSGSALTAKTEVGSWVIGYWRPKLHFEVNVWNCFDRRVRRLYNACVESESQRSAQFPSEKKKNAPDLRVGDCVSELSAIQKDAFDLIITDPPHGDRIPYLELSEMWNAVLGANPDFSREIVVSNARERGKNMKQYTDSIKEAFAACRRVLRPGGVMILLFNSRKQSDWDTIKLIEGGCPDSINFLEFVGCFDCAYSANSVAQDNRKGGLKIDYGLVFVKSKDGFSQSVRHSGVFASLPNWSENWPIITAEAA